MSFKLAVASLLLVILNTKAELCKTPDNKSGECVLLRECSNVLLLTANNTNNAVEFVRKSICGFSGVDSKVCCPTQNLNNSSDTPKNKTSNIHLLPDRRFCGYQHSDDYFHQTNRTEITEFPWLAHIAYRRMSESEDSYKKVYRCVGSLINNRYILTTAVCVTTPDDVITEVRLGEYHIVNDTDCVSDTALEECSESVRDYKLAKIIPHPEFNNISYINDIALLRLKEAVNYSDYIRPICLPFPGTTYANIGDTLTTSGWGLRSEDGDRAMIKKKVLGQIISNDECLQIFKSYNEYFTLIEGQLCTISPQNGTDFSCAGDAGAPVSFSHRLQWHQEGIVSYGRRCEAAAPKVHTKVRYYLDWILETIEP